MRPHKEAVRRTNASAEQPDASKRAAVRAFVAGNISEAVSRLEASFGAAGDASDKPTTNNSLQAETETDIIRFQNKLKQTQLLMHIFLDIQSNLSPPRQASAHNNHSSENDSNATVVPGIKTSAVGGHDHGWARFDALVREAHDLDAQIHSHEEEELNHDKDDDTSTIDSDSDSEENSKSGSTHPFDSFRTYSFRTSRVELPRTIQSTFSNTYNYALMHHEMGHFRKTIRIVSPILAQIDSIDRALGLRICMLMLDACIHSSDVVAAANCMRVMEQSFMSISETVFQVYCESIVGLHGGHASTSVSKKQKQISKSIHDSEIDTNAFTHRDYLNALARAVPVMYLGNIQLMMSMFRSRLHLETVSRQPNASHSAYQSVLDMIHNTKLCLDDTVSRIVSVCGVRRHEVDAWCSPAHDLAVSMTIECFFGMNRDHDAVNLLHEYFGNPVPPALNPKSQNGSTSTLLRDEHDRNDTVIRKTWPAWAWHHLSTINNRSNKYAASVVCLSHAICAFESIMSRKRCIEGASGIVNPRLRGHSINVFVAHESDDLVSLHRQSQYAAIVDNVTRVRQVYRGVYARLYTSLRLQCVRAMMHCGMISGARGMMVPVIGRGVPVYGDRFMVPVHPTTSTYACISAMMFVDMYMKEDVRIAFMPQKLEIRVGMGRGRGEVVVRLHQLVSRYDYGVWYRYLCAALAVMENSISVYGDWIHDDDEVVELVVKLVRDRVAMLKRHASIS